MQELLTKSTEEGGSLTASEICDRVLGIRSGYIKGLGYGPKPNTSTSTTNTLLQELQEKLKQSQAENSQLKDQIQDVMKKVESREALLAKHELYFRRMFSDYDDDLLAEEEGL